MPYHLRMQHVIDRLGGPKAVARLCKVTSPSVTQWRQRGIPIERCVAIERATGGKFMRWDLRPADWPDIWPELIGRPDAPPVPAGTSAFGGLDEDSNPQKEPA